MMKFMHADYFCQIEQPLAASCMHDREPTETS